MRRILLVASFCSILLAGCVTQELRNDQDQIRSTLLDLYTNQIVDNLIRTADGMPIIQLDYSQATGTVTLAETGNISGGSTNTGTNALTLPAKALALTHSLAKALSASLSATHTNQVAVTATPQTAANEVYDAYLEFLSLPGSLRITDEPPGDGEAHICRKSCHRYYWVPCEYKFEFLRLSLLTTAQRGKTLLTPDDFFTVSITDVVDVAPGQFDKTQLVTVRLANKIPNDLGYLEWTDGNNLIQYNVKKFRSKAQDVPSETDQLVMAFVPEKDINTVIDLKAKFPITAKVYLQHKQPKPPTTDDLLQQVRFQLEQIRMNQVRQGG